MGFTIPNYADATYPTQSEFDSRDMDIIIAAFDRTFVVSGCGVTAQGAPDMTVAIAAGSVRIAGVLATVASVASLPIAASDPTDGRFDLITVNASGVPLVVLGSAVSTPVFPVIPAGRVVIAAVYVPPGAIQITATQIIDKRVICTLSIADVGEPPQPGLGNSRAGELVGVVDGANKVYTVPVDYVAGTLNVFVGGIMIRPADYTISGVGLKTVTLGAQIPAPQVGEWVGGTWDI